jgi:hypothetical protein
MPAPTILGKRMRSTLVGYGANIGGLSCQVQQSVCGFRWRPAISLWHGRYYRNPEAAARALERKLIQLHAELGKRIGGEK